MTDDIMSLSSFASDRATHHEIIPFYQPVVNSETEYIVGCEVQPHRLHSEPGLYSDSRTMGSAEMLELINSVIFDIKHFKWMVPDKFFIGIKCTFAQISLQPFCDHLIHLSAQCRRGGMVLLVEFTERENIKDFPDSFHVIMALRARGIIFALDHYKALPEYYELLYVIHPRYIKMDKDFLFLIDIDIDMNIHAKIDHVIHISELIGTVLIATGVENLRHMKYLQDKKILCWQGGACGHPMLPGVMTYYLTHQNKNIL